MHRLTLKIHGNVQGVTFRWEARDMARKLGLVGYVKNLPNGTVDLVAEGEEEVLKKMLGFCKIGPSWATVSKVEEKREEITERRFEEFKIIF